MKSNDLHASLAIIGLILLTVGIGLAMICLLVNCASAGDVIYETDFKYDSPQGYGYCLDEDISTTTGVDCTPYRLRFKNIENFDALTYIAIRWDADMFIPAVDGDENILYSYWKEHDDAKIGAVVIGNITHGYTYSIDKETVVYMFHVEDWDISGFSGEQEVTLDANEGVWKFVGLPRALPYDIITANEVIFVYPGSTQYAVAYDPTPGTYGDPNHWYTVSKRYKFWNHILIEDLGISGLYYLTIQRENLPGWTGGVESKALVYDDQFCYLQEGDFVATNVSVFVTESACDWLYVGVDDSLDIADFVNVTGLCDVAEPGYFDLSGYTRSVQGNLIPGVSLEIKGENNFAMSTNEGIYCFGDKCSDVYLHIPELNETNFGDSIETGSFTLDCFRSGYYNSSESLYIGSPGEYQHDVYMIPLDTLDEGEFGGVVYDYCSLEPIQGAYLYLFNETESSGKYVYSNKYGFYRFVGLTEGLEYQVSASKEGYAESIIHEFTFNESNINETHYKTKNIWLLPEGGCPEDEDGGIPTVPPSPTPTPHEWTNEEIVSWLRSNLMVFFIIVFLFTFLWFIRRAGGSKR